MRLGDKDVSSQKIAVLIPCLNEEATVGKVIDGFRQNLPKATIYVFDNASTDQTASMARAHGAIVRRVAKRGKGYVVRNMLREVDADYYLIADGDFTYPPDAAKDLLKPLWDGDADMSVGVRLECFSDGSFPAFHHFGNRIITGIVNRVFDIRVCDVLSGYRAFTRRFAKKVPLVSKGFDIELELTINALERSMEIVEVPIQYGVRPEGSDSKLRTFRDGFLIFFTIITILKDFRPLFFFGNLALLTFTVGLAIGVPVVIEYFFTGLVPRFPSAILAASLVLLAFQLLGIGLMLDTAGRNRRLQFDLIDKL